VKKDCLFAGHYLTSLFIYDIIILSKKKRFIMLYRILLGTKNYGSRELAQTVINDFVEEANYKACDFEIVEVK